MSEVKYSKEHEWIKIEGDVGIIGITQHATEMLGDIVFVELPDVGSSVEKDGNAGVVESTKAASDVYKRQIQLLLVHLHLVQMIHWLSLLLIYQLHHKFLFFLYQLSYLQA